MGKLTEEQMQEVKDYVHQVLDEYNNPLGLLFHALIVEVEEGRRVFDIPRNGHAARGKAIFRGCPSCGGSVLLFKQHCPDCGVRLQWKQ